MPRVPPEPPTWSDPPDPEATARELREQLDAAKALMREHRETMHAAGLTHLKGEGASTAP
ncbi:MAG TPA: hypothetical protein VGC92_17050 [Phenylobacterium sp.]|jgi:hypothetical protein